MDLVLDPFPSPLDGRYDAVSTRGGIRMAPTEGESSLELLKSARNGDRGALDRLCERYLPVMARWASGRLPRWARDLLDTNDLVQEALLRTLDKVQAFEPRHEGALQAYLRQAVHNRIQDEIRRARRRPVSADLPDETAHLGPSPLEEAVGREAVEVYEAALARLSSSDREVIIARIELGMAYDRVAEALGKPSIAAAQMAVSRALVRLAREMGHEQQ